jgi:aminopeptidase N
MARNADAAQWERLRAQAQAEQNPLVKGQLYRLLGATRDPELARRALALALTPEPGATTSAGIISTVAGSHPELAWQFAMQNRQAVEGLVDVSSRGAYLPGLAAGATDPTMIQQIEDYARTNMTAQSRGPADRASGSIRQRLRVRQERLPDITRWFESRGRS